MKIFFIAIAVIVQTASGQDASNPNQQSLQRSDDLMSSGTAQHYRAFNPASEHNPSRRQSGPPLTRGSHYNKQQSQNPQNYQSGSHFSKPSQNSQDLQSYTTYSAGPIKHLYSTQQSQGKQPIEHPFAPNVIPQDPPKPISLQFASSGPGFMRLLLGSMGIHLGGGGGGRGRKPHGPKPPGVRGNPLSSVNSIVNTPYPHGPANPVHFSNHLQAVQGIAQMQHVQFSHEQGEDSGKPVEYQSSGESSAPVAIQHHYYPPPSPFYPQLAPFPVTNYVGGPQIANYPYAGPSSPYVTYGDNFIPANSPVTSNESPESYTESEIKEEPQQVSYAHTSERGSSSKKKKPVKDSAPEPSVSSSQYDESLLALASAENNEPPLQPYTIIEKPVVHYIEKPVYRFVEKTVVRTVEKPVIKYVEKPVIRYVQGPPPVEHKTKGDTYIDNSDIVKSIEPEIRSNVQQRTYSPIAPSHKSAPHDNSHEFYSSYGAAYFRKNPVPAPKVSGAKEVLGDNAFKKPIIHIPKELPAFSPSPNYKAIKTHIYGPTVSGEGLNLPPFGQTGETQKLEVQAPNPTNAYVQKDLSERFLL